MNGRPATATGTGPSRRGPSRPVRLARALARLPVRVYMRWISPWTPPSCRFRPTCSAYADEALALHGVWRGGWLAVRRLLRCHAFSDVGIDPVPGGRLDGPEVARLELGPFRARRTRPDPTATESDPDGPHPDDEPADGAAHGPLPDERA